MKIRPIGAELFRDDGQTDTTKLIVAFRIFFFAAAHSNYALCPHMLCVNLRTDCDYFAIRCSLIGFCNRDGVSTARYGLDL